MNLLYKRKISPINWPVIVMFALGFWLSGSLVLDAVIIPGLFTAGMMSESGFASAGYLIFGTFNHVELLCAAMILSGLLVLCHERLIYAKRKHWLLAAGIVMLAISLSYTYGLTPLMSAMGLPLNYLETPMGLSNTMVTLHEGYWLLEAIKLLLGAVLLRWCYGASTADMSDS